MIRQKITNEQYNKLTKNQLSYFEEKTEALRALGMASYSMHRGFITIGVLQGLLLDAGHSIEMDKYDDGKIYVNVGDTFIQRYTSEPIDILLEAVLTLVIGED